ncbi:G2/mitotic-specific cyclin-B3 isoform X2 [Bubalus kerabau]|uniref:G2/mitotic-specific cyclin-B3 isoform X2 n=1 Tax=Bubalus carabanensis TaxID=3119969 RepID=UPI00244E677E|nr:G2/mitotic-specific cyclin-B3 isoform X2 [Bubalus carabanensis]
MPLPLPSQHSKRETRKSQSSIVPSDREPSEKKDEKYQAKISPSSPQGPLKKRSAFEDLTNAPQSQPVQPKKEANNEFVKDTSKKRNRNTSANRLPENNKMSIKRCKVELSPIVVSTTTMPNIIDNLLTQGMSTSSKTPNTEEASLFKEPFILKEESTSEDAVLMKRSLSSKKCTNQGVMSLLQKPLSLQGKSDSDVVQPMTFGKKRKTEEAAITNRTLSFKNMCPYQEKQSCSGEELALQDVSVEEDSSFMALQNVRKKPKTEEATFTNPLSSLNKMYTTQRKMSCRKNPLVLQKTTSEEKPLTKESFKRKPTAEESFFQEPPALQEKHTSEQEISMLKKSLAFQEKIDTEEKSLFKEPLALTKQSTTEETTFTMRPLPLEKKCTTQSKMTYSKTTTSGEKALISQLLSFEKKPTPKEESLFQDLSVLQEKHTDDGAVTLVKKPWALQKKDDEDDFLMEPLSFRKTHTTKEATLPKKPLLLKRKCTTQGKIYHLKKPLVLQKVTSEEKSLVQEPLPFKKPPTTKESLFQEPSALQGKHTILEEASILKKPLVLQKIPTEEESLKKETLIFKKFTTGEATSTNMLLSLKNKCTTQAKSCLTKPLVLQTISEEKSLIKEPTTEVESLLKEPSALQEKHTTQGYVAPLKKPWALQERIDSKDEFLMEPLSFRKTHTTNVAVSTEESSSLMKQMCSTQTIMSICQELLGLQNMIGEGKNSFMMPVSSRKKSSTDEAVLTKTPLSPKMRQITQWNTIIEKTTSEEESLFKKLLPLKKMCTPEEELLFQGPSVLKEKHTSLQQASLSKKPLTLQENIASKEESYIKELLTMEKSLVLQKTDTKVDFSMSLALQKKSTTEEKFFFEKPLVLKEKLSPKAAASIEGQSSFKKQPTAQGKVFLLKKQSTLQENITSEEECIIKQPQALQEKSSVEKETILRESLALQENSTIGEAVWKEPLALQKTLTHRENTFLKDCTLQIQTSSGVSTTIPESGTGLSNTITMSSSTISKSSTCESNSDKPFSSSDKRSQQEVIPLGNTDIDFSDPFFSSVYAKDIFSYMKKREEKFVLNKYMTRQTEIDSDMRAILVDWLVEVQISFEMSHETLYLAVKLVDHYLMKEICKKDKLQLLGSTAFLIAAKFEECCPPSVDDILYICNDIYKRDEMLAMEASILKILKFDINIPIAYHFLRRYAKCVYASMKTLTLSRFICELTLVEYDYVQERASKLAAASFFLALCMNKLGHWAPILEYYSGYRISDLHALVRQLNILLTFHSCNRLKAIHSKYSNKVFFEVTKIPPLDMLALDRILRCC